MAVKRPHFSTKARTKSAAKNERTKSSSSTTAKTSKASRTVADHLSQMREVSRHSVNIGPREGRHASINLGLVIVLVAAMLVFIAPPGYTLLNTYHEAQVLQRQLADEKQRNSDLRDEIAKWDDPDFIETQARSRLGYVKPGQTRYQVVDAGKDVTEQRQKNIIEQPQQPWFILMQESIKTAGSPDTEEKIVTRKGVPAKGLTEKSQKE